MNYTHNRLIFDSRVVADLLPSCYDEAPETMQDIDHLHLLLNTFIACGNVEDLFQDQGQGMVSQLASDFLCDYCTFFTDEVQLSDSYLRYVLETLADMRFPFAKLLRTMEAYWCLFEDLQLLDGKLIIDVSLAPREQRNENASGYTTILADLPVNRNLPARLPLSVKHPAIGIYGY